MVSATTLPDPVDVPPGEAPPSEAPPSEKVADAVPRICNLRHRAFHATPGVAFRRDESNSTTLMVLPLGEREAALPVRAVQREFQIEPDSEDGRMIGLIENALDYVPGIALGDELPGEVTTGEASWEPQPHHLWLAASRLRAGLLHWLSPGRRDEMDPARMMEMLVADAELRESVQAAFEHAAHALGMERAEDAVAAVDQMARELSYIEALRETLLARVQAMVRRLVATQPARGTDVQRAEMLQRVGFLATAVLRQMNGIFEELDAQTGEVMPALRNAAQHIAFIRKRRDALFSASREWSPLLDAWDVLPSGQDEDFWALLARSYHFLAGRHLPATEWRRIGAEISAAKAAARGMIW
jgi:hypothetical protein